MKKYKAIRADNNYDKSIWIEGYLYEYGGDKYLVPYENYKYAPNHMYLILIESLIELEN